MSRRWAATTRRSVPACCRGGARSCAASRPTRPRSAASSTASGRPRAGACSAWRRWACASREPERGTRWRDRDLSITLRAVPMFSLIPKEVRFYDYFEQQSKHILNAAALLHDLCHNFSDARAKTHKIKEVEHAGDQVIHDLATRLDDVLDYIEAAAERLVVYRIKEPTSACRAMADVIVKTTEAMDRAIRCLRNMDPGFHEHAVEVNRLENSADNLLRDSLAALFDDAGDPT